MLASSISLLYSCSDTYTRDLLTYLSDIMQSSYKTSILGDFNCPDIDWSTFSSDYAFSSSLCDLVFQYDFTQVIDCPTHVHGKILDLILTNSPDYVATITVSKEFM